MTILHQEAHRKTQIPQRSSRHYYDLYKLAVSRVRASALADPKLLQDVVAFKRRFYPSAWARYDLAVPGSLKLLPATHSHVKGLVILPAICALLTRSNWQQQRYGGPALAIPIR